LVDSNAELESKLRRLTHVYAQELPAKLLEIANRWINLKSDWHQETAKELYREVHSLSGSSGSYGAPELHLQARNLESKISRVIDYDQSPSAEEVSQIDAALGLTAAIGNAWAAKIIESNLAQPDSPISGSFLQASDEAGPADLREAHQSPDYRFLYIEDNRANLNLVKQLVQVHWPNAELLTAEDPLTGLELLNHNEIQIVLLDINLPVMSGYEVLARIRENEVTSAIPVIAVSANAMPSDVKAGIEAGFNEYITKPIKIDDFFEIIDQILAQKTG
jgi:CheY-like chemotaxis protein/HPt (histidine-containing phosphotransfer) domain-containing protein